MQNFGIQIAVSGKWRRQEDNTKIEQREIICECETDDGIASDPYSTSGFDISRVELFLPVIVYRYQLFTYFGKKYIKYLGLNGCIVS